MDVRIMMVSRFFHPHTGGSEKQCFLLASDLVRQGVVVGVITERYSRLLPKQEIIEGVRVIRCPSLRMVLGRYGDQLYQHLPDFTEAHPPGEKVRRVLPRAGRIVRGIVRIVNEYSFMLWVVITLVKHRTEYDIIHGHQANWIAVACALGGDIVHKPVLIKDATLDGFSTLSSVRLGKRARTHVLQRCHFVAISSDIRSNLLSYGIRQEKVSYCPNGVELSDGKWVIPVGASNILFVGNFWQGPIKGLDVLISAMKEIARKIESAQLVIAGEGEPSSHMEMISELGLQERIRFLGVADDVRSLFAKASVFVLPSRQEGMSNVLLEAMEFGMPVIATKVSGSVDLIQDNLNGLLVPASDANALAKAIMRLLEDPETAIRFGRNARLTIEEKFAMDRVTQQYKLLYRTLVQPVKS